MPQIYGKYETMLRYLVFGCLTTLLNIVAYMVFSRLFAIQFMVSNMMAWITAVLFAYVTNRWFVFESQCCAWLSIIKECAAFFGCRMLSGLADAAIMYSMIDLLHCNDLFVKVVTNIFVICINYIFSKRVIFRPGNQGEVI